MWTSGYVSEVDYTHGYYRELSPHFLSLAVLSKKVDHSLPSKFSYLELGFGQGLSLNIHAAATTGTYMGTDFNPSQAATAQELAKTSGSGLIALDDSFKELSQREDLPEFDIIALHGIWSWISNENRSFIVDLARKRLKPGGLFYISYNVTPGWSPAMPLRHLMTQHAERAGTGTIINKIDASLEFAQKLVDAGASYFKANPAVTERLKKITEQNKNYLAHEYFNADWHPMPFSETATLLSEAKLSFAASANILDNIDAINLSKDAQSLLNEIADPILKETVRDYFVNQQFRKDIFIKGHRELSPLQQLLKLKDKYFILLDLPENVPKKVSGALGEADLQESVYSPIIKALSAENATAKNIEQLQQNCPDISLAQIIEALTILVGAGWVLPAQDKAVFNTVKKITANLNNALKQTAEVSQNINFLASPVTGGGVSVNRFEQMFLRARDLKISEPPLYVWERLKAQGQVLQKDGEPIQDEDANIAELKEKYESFMEKRLPILKRLGVN